MNAEVLFWAGIIMLSPTFYVLGKSLARFLIDMILPDDRIIVSYTDTSGRKSSKLVHLNDGDELSQVLKEIRSARDEHRGGKHA